ncbi:hypothetical protein HYG93_07500 [Acinetobacter sp. SwsAc6]|uniref:hypothetical protein n=1 Tax=Acinetobacter sp. SwsAc6 TaxID=2749439 RepID=UPI0015BB79F7|nr:hypothetical protein [Acinetobacter sp. SwsAc6]NWK74134.1 hypothetical protein [Acinetobacter sp. SwsAc6]
MKLIPTPASVLPEQLVIDTWPLWRKASNPSVGLTIKCNSQQEADDVKKLLVALDFDCSEFKSYSSTFYIRVISDRKFAKTYPELWFSDRDVNCTISNLRNMLEPVFQDNSPVLANSDEAKFYGQALIAEGYVP